MTRSDVGRGLGGFQHSPVWSPVAADERKTAWANGSAVAARGALAGPGLADERRSGIVRTRGRVGP